ncbi:hypothetical protein BG621_08210 [Parasaccharibacter apium]|nr:lysophospholipase [Bombella apis]PHI94182.1 hypothetical protein BG621_08210 [Parasaccharibacter apium]
MTTLYYLHGWGYDAHFWEGLHTHLPSWQHICADAGYFGSPAHPPLPEVPFWAVGHSAGACALLTLRSPLCRGLISFNGFARFTAAPDYPEGLPPRIMHRMIRQFERQPATVLRQFRHMCGEPDPTLPSTLNLPALTDGLTMLETVDHRDHLPYWQGRLYSLHCVDDPLIPARSGMGAAAWGVERTGGHRLPLTHPQECAAFLTRIINASL